MVLKEINKDNEIKEISRLANIIWNEAYKELLSKNQITYMLEKYLSFNAIKTNISEGYKYTLLVENNCNIGFMAYIIYENYIFLSKLYILNEYMDKGFGSQSINYLKKYNLPIELTVNKYNINAYNKYLHLGFNVIDSVVTDIGNGYVMDDYIMRKK